MKQLKNKQIVLGITGSIAAYKACELTRLLVAAGADVRVVMSKAVGDVQIQDLQRKATEVAIRLFVLAGLVVTASTGLVFGITPARRAARLDPVLALARH